LTENLIEDEENREDEAISAGDRQEIGKIGERSARDDWRLVAVGGARCRPPPAACGADADVRGGGERNPVGRRPM